MISIIIPCHNEERRVEASMARLSRYCEERFQSHEILVVDDGSTDRTWEVVQGMRGRRVRAIHLPRNRGKGAAVRAGMLEAGGALRFFTDADLPYHLSAFSSAIDLFHTSKCDLVIGARDLPGSLDSAGTSRARKTASRIFSVLTGLLLGADVRDTQCGFKGFTERAAKTLFRRSTIDGFAFDVEILTLAKGLGFPICRMPVTLVVNQDSSISLPRDGLTMLREVIRVRRSMQEAKRTGGKSVCKTLDK
jgi:dolichyl-phosphate beta-glucosyltransferase